MKTKIMSFLLILSLFVTLFSANVFAVTENNDLDNITVLTKEKVAEPLNKDLYEEIYNDILSEYMDLDMFIQYINADKKAAMDMIEAIADQKYIEMTTPSTRGGDIAVAYVDGVKTIIQNDTYNCGYVNVLMALYGMNLEGSVPGSTDVEKCRQIETDIGHYGTSIVVWEAVNYLNNKIGSTKYKFTEGETLTESAFANKIAASLVLDYPVLLHARTKPIGYYNGKDIGHYLTVDYIDQFNDKVRVRDCHFNSLYGGYHEITQNEAYKSVSDVSDRFVISY